ncbi:uncharacterized protein B0P05DRAFT_592404 [Gilbertella persicaria]|uniref:uncharacterized protein n=1 Tax=Gilbertella persicaria TaxID=101096 RepID=UPI0022201184|nr:uncharacterized protein B0P05DRAFT_592404 [Gilbertella persicaria]KAI8048058.1 hypothetical protein B0P05DRAFT_592404 [Gilbertella persicaria]
MPDDATAHTHQPYKKKSIDRSRYSENLSNFSDSKSRKFRWSSCFSFVSKFKKPKTSHTQQIRLSQSYEDFEQTERPVIHQSSEIIVKAKSEEFNSSFWPTQPLPLPQPQLQPLSSLSPPPRQVKSKRESYCPPKESVQYSSSITTGSNSRRPLVDPSLTPRVKPRSIKTKRQPSFLRLSLDAEVLHSPESLKEDSDSITTSKTNRSSASLTPTGTNPVPFRSGTLGNSRMSSSVSVQVPPPPPLPQFCIPFDHSRPQSQQSPTTFISQHDSPITSAIDQSDEEVEKLTLKERRHRRSPLSTPNTDQLTLALKGMLIDEEQEKEPMLQSLPQMKNKRQTYNADSTHGWRQHLLEQSIAFSFQDKSRQEAMLSLEGKKPKTISLRPIAQVHDLDSHFDKTKSADVGREKAQYDAIVSRATSLHRRQLSHEENKRSQINNHRTSLRARSSSYLESANELGIICEDKVMPTKTLLFPSHHLTVTPETPPYHKQTAPSLISAPSTPNSIDSCVMEQDDYLSHKKHVSLVSSSE